MDASKCWLPQRTERWKRLTFPICLFYPWQINLNRVWNTLVKTNTCFSSEKEERIAKEKEEGTYQERKVKGHFINAGAVVRVSNVCLPSYISVVSKPRKKGRRREPINASTADEAIEKMLEQKRISTKINYDVLKDLNKSSPKSPTRQTDEVSAGAKRTPTARQRKPQLTSPNIGKTISSFGKRYGTGGERLSCLDLFLFFSHSLLFWIIFFFAHTPSMTHSVLKILYTT